MLYLSILLVCLSLIIFVLLYQRQAAIRQALEPKDEQLQRLDLECQRLRGELAERATQLEQLRQEHSQRLQQLARLEEQTQQQEALKAELASLQQDYLQSQTSLSAQSQELRQLREQLATSRTEQSEISQTLRESFRNLATEVLQGQRAELSTRNLEQLAPLKEELQRFSEQVGKVYNEEARERFSLQREIMKLVERSQELSQETTQLTQALKGDSKVQGDWGEMILERILEQSGLRRDEEYFVQQTLRDAEGRVITTEDNKGGLRPDVLVKYPNGGTLVIDSKVSLTAYLSYLSAETEEQREQAAAAHLLSVRHHIDELAAKRYETHTAGSPNFVMLFVPNEPAYMLALSRDKQLWEYAYRKNVILINGTNLIASLRLAQDMWQRERQDRNVEQILERANKLYDKVVAFGDQFVTLGDRLQKALESYEGAKKSLDSGRGNLVSQFEKLRKLGLNPKRRLTAALRSSEDEHEEEDEEQQEP